VHHATQSGAREAVLRHAPLAAREAAAHSAHREAADLYALALDHAGSDAAVRTPLLEGRAYQCYLTDQITAAIEARQELLAIHRAAGDAQQEGTTLRWLSRLSWFAGDNSAAERYADAAIALLSPLPAGTALAWAMSNRAQLFMLADHRAQAIEWGVRAIALARDLGDDEVLAHALNNVGSVRYRDDAEAGRAELAESLALSLRHRFDEHVARAYANLTPNAVIQREYPLAQRYFDEAAAYFAARDLDSWSNYVLAWRARADFECGRWESAEEIAGRLVARPTSPIIRIGALAVLARLRARRGDSGAAALVAEALELAQRTGEVQRLAPVLAAQAEAAWLANADLTPSPLLRGTFTQALANGDARAAGELGYWMWRGGVLPDPGDALEAPYRAQILGEWRGAAMQWALLGCPFEEAMAQMDGDEEAQRAALRTFESLGAAAAAASCRRRLRDAGARGIPRGPRASTQKNPSGLTAREVEVLALLAQGLANAEIGRRLVRSEKTIDHHVSAILAKLEVRSRTEAVAAALRDGIVKGR
jgi:DNA-binding CsgD family transcriptional regulator